MSYDQYVLPAEHCGSVEAASAHLDSQGGRAPTPEAIDLAARLSELLADELSILPLEAVGDTVGVPVTFRAVDEARTVVYAEARRLGFGVYDPQVGLVIVPGDALPGAIRTGDGDRFPLLTRGVVAQLVAALDVKSFVIVESEDPDTYAQTYRNGADGYTVEHRAGSADRHFATTVRTADEVSRILDAWLRGDTSAIDAVDWERVEF